MAKTKVLPQELSNSSQDDVCRCGQPGCLGHERKTDAHGNGRVLVPGFTSQEELDACPEEIVVFDKPLKPHVIEAVLKKLTGSDDAA